MGMERDKGETTESTLETFLMLSANADEDQKAKERVDKLNQADSLIFQTEKQMTEFGCLRGKRQAHRQRAAHSPQLAA